MSKVSHEIKRSFSFSCNGAIGVRVTRKNKKDKSNVLKYCENRDLALILSKYCPYSLFSIHFPICTRSDYTLLAILLSIFFFLYQLNSESCPNHREITLFFFLELFLLSFFFSLEHVFYSFNIFSSIFWVSSRQLSFF